MSESQNPMDALNALMEERNRYEQWLAQLEARKGTTPPHVFDRVRGDYGDRLNRVLDQLAGRATELQETAGTLAERVAALYADETALRDERAEAELRAAVGEFTVDHARMSPDSKPSANRGPGGAGSTCRALWREVFPAASSACTK